MECIAVSGGYWWPWLWLWLWLWPIETPSMSENRRHPNVVNGSETKLFEISKGTNFGASIRGLGREAGSVQLGGNLVEVPPGRSAFPCHDHCGIEEAIYVIAGTGVVRIGETQVEVKEGDWISFPIGPDYAHRLDNTGDAPLRYLCISNRHTADVVGYPDSKKDPRPGFGQPRLLRAAVGPLDLQRGRRSRLLRGREHGLGLSTLQLEAREDS